MLSWLFATLIPGTILLLKYGNALEIWQIFSEKCFGDFEGFLIWINLQKLPEILRLGWCGITQYLKSLLKKNFYFFLFYLSYLKKISSIFTLNFLSFLNLNYFFNFLEFFFVWILVIFSQFTSIFIDFPFFIIFKNLEFKFIFIYF